MSGHDVTTLFPRRAILPVFAPHSVEEGLAIAEALLGAGLNVLEITLRTHAALPAIAAIARHLPQAVIGVGTIRSPRDIVAAREAGGAFGISPGTGPALFDAAAATDWPFIPGVATPSEAMAAQERGFRFLKLFPAEAVGGAALLKAMHAPLPELRFCPTGGVGPANARTYLDLANVFAIGGSWIVPHDAQRNKDWATIAARAREAAALLA